MSPGVLGNEGERYQRPGGPDGPPGVMLDSPALSSERGHWGSGARHAGRGWHEGSRGQVRRDSRNHRRGSAGVPGRVQRGRRPRRIRRRRGRGRCARGAGVTRARRRLRRRLARRAAGDRRHRRRARRGDGRRRGRRRRWPAPSRRSAEQPGNSVWTPEASLAYGTSYTLTASATNADDKEATASIDVHHRHPGRGVHALDRPAGRHDRRGRHADPRVLRRPGHRQGRGREPPAGHQLHPDRRRRGTGSTTPRCTSARRSTGRRTPRSPSTPTCTASTSARASGARRTARCPSRSVSQARLRRRRRPRTRCRSTTATQLVQTYPDQRRQPGQPELQRRARGHRAQPRPDHGLQHLRRPGRQSRGLPDAGRVRRPHLRQRRVRARRTLVGRSAGQHQRVARLHQHVDRARRLVLQLLPGGRRRGDPQLHRTATCARTSTTGSSRGTSGRPAAP